MRVVPSPGAARARRRGAIVVVALVGMLFVAGGWANFYTELLWFQETGFQTVFTTGLWVRLGLGAAFGLLFAGVLLLNLWIARKITSPARLFTVPDQVLERYRAAMQPYTRWIVIGGAVVFGLFAGSGASLRWRDWLLFQNSVPFGEVDPIFGKDVGFYIFRLPFHQFLYTWAFSSLIVITLVIGFVHYFLGGIRPQAQGERVAPEVRAHLSVLLGLLVVLRAWGYRLDQFGLLHSDRGVVQGASYTDVNAERPALTLLIVIAVICAGLFIANIKVRNWILPLGGIVLLGLTSILAGGVYPAAIQRLRVEPNERIRERPFIERNIAATRKAFGVGDVETRTLSGTQTLTEKLVERNTDTLENVRLWDPFVLRDAYLQLQRITQYYEFLDVDVDRYEINGERRQIMLSAREIHPNGLASEAQTWINRHLVYTHGYGVAGSFVNAATPEGQPEFIMRNIPPVEAPGVPDITQARVYFGEGADDIPFVIVNSRQEELDYPTASGFEPATYDADGGIPLSGVVRRAAFAWRFRDPNILISGAIAPESRIIFRRHVFDRVEQVVPFLEIDPDPYVAVIDGKIVWILDGYTTTDMYPYSQRVRMVEASGGMIRGTANYIRNAVKFVVDAESGEISAYRWDEQDPLIESWSRAFPGILKDRSEIPAEVLAHVRYPEGMFRTQSHMFGSYHISNPDNFYSKEDAWLVANDPNASEFSFPQMPGYYVLMRLPGEEDLSFVLVRPFTPQGRQNMTAYFVAYNDPEDYGDLVSYVFPRSEAILGPEQIFALINQDPVVSPQITLLGQRQSQVLYGNLIIVPIEEALLYVQPLYVRGSGSQFPELKRVVVVSKGRVTIDSSLEGALELLLAGGPRAPDEPGDPGGRTAAEWIEEAIERDQAAQEALRAGDFARYGREQEAMRRALEEAARATGAAPAEDGSPEPEPGA